MAKYKVVIDGEEEDEIFDTYEEAKVEKSIKKVTSG